MKLKLRVAALNTINYLLRVILCYVQVTPTASEYCRFESLFV